MLLGDSYAFEATLLLLQNCILAYRLNIKPKPRDRGSSGYDQTMRAFEIYINGERLCLAGVSNAGIFTTIMEYQGGAEEHLQLDVGGLLIPEQEYVTWQNRSLSVGDDVRIRILESDKVDAPTDRYPTNRSKTFRNRSDTCG